MAKCEYRYTCPNTECEKEKSIDCIGILIDKISEIKSNNRRNASVPLEVVETGTQEEAKIFYRCDRRACDSCGGEKDEPCCYTTDIRHARNFVLRGRDFYEKELI